MIDRIQLEWKNRPFGLADWLGAALTALVSGVFFAILTADYAFPGESARLMASWKGLLSGGGSSYPLMGFFARLLGGGNALAPVCGALSAAALFLFVTADVRRRIDGAARLPVAASAARLAGYATAFVFVFTPAVLSAATHLEPRLFDFTWLVVWLVVFTAGAGRPGWRAGFWTLVTGAAFGLGLVDSAIFLVTLPITLSVVLCDARYRKRGMIVPVVLFLFGLALAFVVAAPLMTEGLVPTLKALARETGEYRAVSGWLFVAVFALLPFLFSRLAMATGLGEKSGFVQWIFHASMSFFVIVAVATPLSPSVLCASAGVLPVAASAFVALTAGYLVVYWRLLLREARVVASVAGGLLAVVLVCSSFFSFYAFDSKAGVFADRIAARILDDLGTRTWFVSDGALDSNLKLLADRRGQELNLIALNRDLDSSYLASLASLVREKRLGGTRCEELAITLSLGVLPFVQDWFAADPNIASQVAVFGAPDLWYSADRPPVPEGLFFGGDPARKTTDAWAELRPLLMLEGEKPGKPWGSTRRAPANRSPLENLRLGLRRHLGLVTTDRGVWLQDNRRDDEAFATYERVLREIDADNVSSILNLMLMADAKYEKAVANVKEYQQRIREITDSGKNRYYLWMLVSYHGYIRNPDAFIRMGLNWARSGRSGEALRQIRRGIDLVPTDGRAAYIQLMTALLATTGGESKARRDLEAIVAKDSRNRFALMSLMQLALADGDTTGAIGFLEKAIEAAGDDPRADFERGMLAILKDDFDGARRLLERSTAENANDPRSLSLLALTMFNQAERTKDPKVREQLRRELDTKVLSKLDRMGEKAAFFAHSTRGFSILNTQGDTREARDAFARALKVQPENRSTQEMVLNLDMVLGDKTDAEARAREQLRRDRNAPLANYILGSLEMQRGEASAELHLRRAADASKPVVFAMNDLAEFLRLKGDYESAERYARKAVKTNAKFYNAWDTLANILIDRRGDLVEAEKCVRTALECSKGPDGKETDLRVYLTLARVQLLRGEKKEAKFSVRKVQPNLADLSLTERAIYDQLFKETR